MSVYYNGNEVSEIVYGTGDTGKLNLKAIGYTDSDIPQCMKDGLEHAKEIQENWDSLKKEGYPLKGDMELVFMPMVDTTSLNTVYWLSNYFQNCTNLISIPKLDTRNVKSMDRCFDSCSSLKEIPPLDTSNVTNISGCFGGCSSLREIPLLDTSKVTNMSRCFYGCSSLTTIPELDTSKVTNMSYCFYGCSSLTTIPKLDTSMVTDMSYCFNGCSSLTTIPELDTGKVTSMYYCFYGCSSLTSIPLLDTGNVENMTSCFYNCSSLTTIPELDTSKVTNMSYCFYGCSNLTEIPELDTSIVTNFASCFYKCDKLKRIEGLSFKSMGTISSTSFLFGSSSNTTCRYILIKDIGTNSKCTSIDTTYSRVWGINSYDVPDARQSLIDSLLTYSFDRKAAGYSNCTIKLYSNVKAVLTSEEITAIQAKGYVIS